MNLKDRIRQTMDAPAMSNETIEKAILRCLVMIEAEDPDFEAKRKSYQEWIVRDLVRRVFSLK